jgi:hypothetical protein
MEELNSVSAVCKNTKEIVLTDPLDDEEVLGIMKYCKKNKYSITVTQSKRMLIIGCDQLEEALELLSTFGLIEYIGSLREIIDWNITKETFKPPSENNMSFTFQPE